MYDSSINRDSQAYLSTTETSKQLDQELSSTSFEIPKDKYQMEQKIK